MDFKGDALVNAANEGCTGGFGVDELVNKSGGPELKAARKLLGGCPTGSARVTPAFAHANTRIIIHAVGPAYRIITLRDGVAAGTPEGDMFLRAKDPLLAAAYAAAMRCAADNGVATVAFCLLSAGVFRGARDLSDIIHIAINAVANASFVGLREVHLVAYTAEEEEALLAHAAASKMAFVQ